MLPFHRARNIAGAIIAKRQPEGSVKDEHLEGSHPIEQLDAADALISAIHRKDREAVVSALKALI